LQRGPVVVLVLRLGKQGLNRPMRTRVESRTVLVSVSALDDEHRIAMILTGFTL
jgi:hypothetical protein